jgi:hypothetical protein
MLEALENSKVLAHIVATLQSTGKNQAIADWAKAFFDYEKNLKKSVAEAQDVPNQIEDFIRNNVAATRVAESAFKFDGTPYAMGGATASEMDCSHLVILAAGMAGVHIPIDAIQGSITKSWFKNGMGPELPQILGAGEGIEVQDLVFTARQNPLLLPYGSVVVADGHAAIFLRAFDVADKHEMIIYDANDAPAKWLLELIPELPAGSMRPRPEDLLFQGHTVGEHLTGYQWNAKTLVKVFLPIGNHSPVSNWHAAAPRTF